MFFLIFNVHYRLLSFTLVYPHLLSYSYCRFHYRNTIAILDGLLIVQFSHAPEKQYYEGTSCTRYFRGIFIFPLYFLASARHFT